MRREELLVRLRALAGPGPRARASHALAGLAARARGGLTGAEARERAAVAWIAIRRRRDALITAGVVLGVLVMLLHWS